MQEVTLRRIGAQEGQGEKVFDLDHANGIFKLQKSDPPATWELADENYTLVKNEIIPRASEGTDPETD